MTSWQEVGLQEVLAIGLLAELLVQWLERLPEEWRVVGLIPVKDNVPVMETMGYYTGYTHGYCL